MLFFQITNVSNHGGKYLMKEQQNLPTKNKKKRILPAIIVAIAITAAIIIAIVYNLPTNRRDRQLALAEKYMSELNYEAAILAYRAAIEIDPKCKDAYIELVNLYVATDAYDKAEEIITYAENNLDDEIILKMREKANTLSAIDATEADNRNTNQEESESSTEEITSSEPYLLYMQATNYDSAGNVTSIKKEEYDTNGNLIIDTLYDIDNNIVHQYTYDSMGNTTSDSIGRPWEEKVYNENGRIVQILTHKTGIDTTLQFWKEYTYDQHDNIIKITTYNPDNTIRDYSEYIYDESYNLFQYIEYYSNGIVRAYHNFDDSENEISSTYYNQDGTIGGINYIFEYNSNNQLIKKTGYYADGSIYDWTEYAYDSTGNQLSVITYNSDNLITSYYGYEYDVNGNCTIEEHYTNYNSEYDNYYIIKNIYDEQNNLLKSERFNRDGDILFKTEYSYDYK